MGGWGVGGENEGPSSSATVQLLFVLGVTHVIVEDSALLLASAAAAVSATTAFAAAPSPAAASRKSHLVIVLSPSSSLALSHRGLSWWWLILSLSLFPLSPRVCCVACCSTRRSAGPTLRSRRVCVLEGCGWCGTVSRARKASKAKLENGEEKRVFFFFFSQVFFPSFFPPHFFRTTNATRVVVR